MLTVTDYPQNPPHKTLFSQLRYFRNMNWNDVLYKRAASLPKACITKVKNFARSHYKMQLL